MMILGVVGNTISLSTDILVEDAFKTQRGSSSIFFAISSVFFRTSCTLTFNKYLNVSNDALTQNAIWVK